MTIRDLIEEKREDILRLAAKNGAANVRLFGSVLKGEAGPDSDVDFLVDLAPDRSLLDHIALIQDLEDLLGLKVDVATAKGLHWFLRDRVLQEAQRL
jgi:predicted nucleotidyltransferase